MKVIRVERHVIKKSHPMYEIIDAYTYKSKNIYNFANYIVRQEFIKNNKYIPYKELSKKIKHEDPFKDIGSNSAQMTLKILHQNWKSYFSSINDWSKNKNKYLGKPKLPNYLDKDGRFVFVLTNVQSKIVNGYLRFSFTPLKPYNNLIKTNIFDKLMQSRFIPKNDCFVLEIVYEKVIKNENENNESRIIGIDLGVDRFATIQNNFGMKSIAINGGKIKSVNNFYNKEVANYQSKLKRVNDENWSKRLQRLTTKRENKIDYILHCVSKYIVDYCLSYDIDIVVVGYNKGWKQKVNLGKNVNQKFISIPYDRFLSKLEYKLSDNGIKFIITEESYTSKASFLDHDEMKGNVRFNGKRIERGLYQSKNGNLINADLNGAGNIIRKVFPEAFADGIKGVCLHPTIINVV